MKKGTTSLWPASKTGLALALLLGSTLCAASDEVGMYLDLRINQTERGEFVTYRTPDGDFLVRLADFSSLGLKRDGSLPRVRVEGEIGSLVSLREMGATNLVMDTARMKLDIELPPDAFDKTTVDVAAVDTRYSLESERTSGFVNYRLAETSFGASTANAKHTLSTEWGLRYGGVLLLDQHQFRDDGGTSRYLTQLVYDRPEVHQRFIAGDFTALSSELGSVLPMGGLNFSKVYSMSTELITQPMAGFAGVATSPSQVEVRVGGAPVAYSQVGPGPFELQNLYQFGGANDVQVLIRDALGRERVVAFPFYFSDQSLRQGLHEYSYALGKIRTNVGQPGDSYEDTAFSGFHRFGFSDALTLGGRAEAGQELSNVGLEAAWRHDQIGVLAAAVSGSNYKGQAGDATMLSYNYRQSKFAFTGIARRFSSHYAPLETLVSVFNRSADYGASLSWYPESGINVTLNHTLTQTRDDIATRISSASFISNLGPTSFLYATLQRTDETHNRPNTSLFIGWLYRFGTKYTASANATHDETGKQTLITQLARDIPNGEGVGYRVGWTGTQPQDSDRFSGYAQWNLPALSLSVDANTLPAQAGRSDYRELAMAGSVAFAGKSWGFSRTIADSFAIAGLGAPVAGVRVMANNQEIGFTNDSGQVISPVLGSFYESRISVNDQDIPLQYVMKKNVYAVRPVYRSGVEVPFGLRRVQGVTGVLKVRDKQAVSTADNRIVTLTKGNELQQEFQVGRQGHFYIENIGIGDYLGEIKSSTGTCHFELKVPDTPEAVLTLPGDLICE